MQKGILIPGVLVALAIQPAALEAFDRKALDELQSNLSGYLTEDPYVPAPSVSIRLAEQGNADGQFQVGSMYETGTHMLKDPAQAAQWYRLAASQGHAEAQAKLGGLFDYERTRLRDDVVTAHMWYNISSANGFRSAGTLRDALEDRMSNRQINRAIARATACMNSNYGDCD